MRIAVPGPFLHGLDYILPETLPEPAPGARVWVPIARRRVVGLVMGTTETPEVALDKLKEVLAVLDDEPIFPPVLLKLLQWISQYYHSPIGEVVHTALPALLCQGEAFVSAATERWRLTEAGRAAASRSAPKQTAALSWLRENPEGVSRAQLNAAGINLPIIKALLNKQYLQVSRQAVLPMERETRAPRLSLNPAQAEVLAACQKSLGVFSVKLLEGITGSGKTEVYLQLIAEVLARGEQALVLVPEIGLTPQMVERFQTRFTEAVVVLHSGLTETEKLQHWRWAADGAARIIIGTRSAVFVPCRQLGVVIIDEEHDASFKQQSGVRYSARDVAIVRAQLEGALIVLGSATPSLESLHNAATGKYEHLHLPARAGVASRPKYHLIDMRQQPLQAGLSRPLLSAMQQHLKAGNQVLLFLNRRGYAPVLMCHACGWTATCPHCDAYLTLHQRPLHLNCHHCGAKRAVCKDCPACAEQNSLLQVGVGTERIEEALEQLFPEFRIVRLDRSNVQRKGELERLLNEIHQGKAEILVGTQMLAKGHHFAAVTLVGVVNIDGGLFSSDFRALEHTGQLLLQVAGRAGRVEKQGEVYIQTHHPEHPLLLALLEEGYGSFARQLLNERGEAHWPPFAYLALLRAEAATQTEAADFLSEIRALAESWHMENLSVLGPVPAFMQRRAGYYRLQLLFRANERRVLQACLSALNQHLYANPKHKIRWHIDIDPIEMG